MRVLLATAFSAHAEIARDLVAEAVGPDQRVGAAARAEQCLQPRTGSRSRPDVIVRFLCAREEHLANPVPGGPGLLVSHHGTFGYCPARVAEGHAWKDIHRVTLSDLEHYEPEGTAPWVRSALPLVASPH